jgi:hypothetical protein
MQSIDSCRLRELIGREGVQGSEVGPKLCRDYIEPKAFKSADC